MKKGVAITDDNVLEVGKTYYIRECGYYKYDATNDKYVYTKITDDDGSSNDDSEYVTDSTWNKKTSKITLEDSDANKTIRIGNCSTVDLTESSYPDWHDVSKATWVNTVKRGDLCVYKANDAGVAVSGITFELNGNGISLTATTDGDGYAYFTNVPIGDYQLVEYPNDNYKVETDGNGNITAPTASSTWVDTDGIP